MQLTLYTDYSLRVLLYLAAHPGKSATITEIAEFHHISRNHLVKVVHNLAQLGFIHTQRGKHGGIQLAHAPEDISIGHVVRQTEPNFFVVECFNPDATPCQVTAVCTLKHVLYQATQDFLKTLDGQTLATALHRPSPAAAVFPFSRLAATVPKKH